MFPYVRYGQEETVRKGKTPKVVQGASACITKYKITEAHKVPGGGERIANKPGIDFRKY